MRFWKNVDMKRTEAFLYIYPLVKTGVALKYLEFGKLNHQCVLYEEK